MKGKTDQVMKLLIVRHGLTDWNLAQRFQGQSNIPLNGTGQKQAEALAVRLSAEPIHAIYASDLQRAIVTAQAIAARHKCTNIPDSRLREINFGRWDGLTYGEIGQRDRVALAAWKSNILEVAPPSGETLSQLSERVGSVLDEIQKKHAGETVLIVAHGGPLQVMLCLALGFSPSTYWQFHLSIASISEVAFYPGGAILNSLNDTCHLNGDTL